MILEGKQNRTHCCYLEVLVPAYTGMLCGEANATYHTKEGISFKTAGTEEC